MIRKGVNPVAVQRKLGKAEDIAKPRKQQQVRSVRGATRSGCKGRSTDCRLSRRDGGRFEGIALRSVSPAGKTRFRLLGWLVSRDWRVNYVAQVMSHLWKVQ